MHGQQLWMKRLLLTCIELLPCRFREMRESNQAMSEVALNLYRECLRKVLMQRGGYECQETEGSFMLSFYNCVDAVQFCILVSVA